MHTPSAAGILGSRPLRDDRGFTVLELVVVVMIINILVAIAIPSYLGVAREAQDRASQSDLRAALVVARTISAGTSAGLYRADGVDIDPSMLAVAEPSLTYGPIEDASDSVIGVLVAPGGGRITFTKQGNSGRWFGLSSDSRGEITFCSSATAGGCDDGGTDVFVGTAW